MFSSILVLACIALPLALSNMDMDQMKMNAIEENLNKNMSACEDFWGYTCGNWYYGFVDFFDMMDLINSIQMYHILNDNHTETPRLMQQINDYWNACSNDVKEELQPPQEPLEGQFEWTRATAKLRKYGLNGVFYDESVDVAHKDSLQYVVRLKMPATQNDNLAPAELERFVAELRDLQSKHRTEEPSWQSWSLAQLQQQIPQIDWQIYFNELLDEDVNSSELRVEVSDVEYLRDLGTLLQRSSENDLKLYLRLHLTNFAKELNPSPLPQYRMKACVRHMLALLPLGMNYIYDRYAYKVREQETQQLEELFANLREMFGKYLKANRLQLTNEQLDYVRAKLAKMRIKIGNLPESTVPGDFYDSHYASASFRPTDFQHNVWEALLLRTRLQYAPLKTAGHRVALETYYVNDNILSPRDVPYLEHARNTLTVPMMYQSPIYNNRLHAIFRGSIMGFMLAHELTLAFGEEGILYDADGNFSPLGLNIRQMPTFQAALSCVQRSPTAYPNERLADVNALQLAYDTYFGWPQDASKVEHEPFSFEQEYPAPQLFHLSFAQYFSAKSPIKRGYDLVSVRLEQAIQNLQQFYIDFDCGKKPESADICEMWRPAEGYKEQ